MSLIKTTYPRLDKWTLNYRLELQVGLRFVLIVPRTTGWKMRLKPGEIAVTYEYRKRTVRSPVFASHRVSKPSVDSTPGNFDYCTGLHGSSFEGRLMRRRRVAKPKSVSSASTSCPVNSQDGGIRGSE